MSDSEPSSGVLSADEALLSVEGLRKHYVSRPGLIGRLFGGETERVRAVDDVSFRVQRGETLGIVGESGCGKSTLVRTLIGLYEPTEGSVSFTGTDVHEQVATDRKRFTRRAQFVFQDPSSCLDPRMTLRAIVREPLDIHSVGAKPSRNERVETLIERVGLSTDQLDRYPSEFSGGQRQRIAIARALALDPELLILDEPTSALDVSVQAQIIDLLREIQSEFDLTYLFISHDLSVIRHMCDRVAVMYLGRMAEVGPTEAVFERPTHPYTRALLNSVPRSGEIDDGAQVTSTDVPSPRNPPSGCRFHTRCPDVLPPDQYEMGLDRDAWLAVFGYKLALQSGDVDLDRIVRRSDLDVTAESTPESMRELVRNAYGIPPVLSDETADGLLEDSLDALVDGDDDTARSIMESDFSSPCERTQPSMVPVSDVHHAACLLAEDASE